MDETEDGLEKGDDDANDDFDADFVDEDVESAEPVEEIDIESLRRMDPAQRAARALKVRRGIEERQEQRRLESELDYLDDIEDNA